MEIEYLTEYKETNSVDEHWLYLKDELISLIDYRLKTSNNRWYQEQYMYDRLYIDEFHPSYPEPSQYFPCNQPGRPDLFGKPG